MRRNLKKALLLLGLFALVTSALAGQAMEGDVNLYQKAKQAAAAVKGKVPDTELEQLVVDLAGPDPVKSRIAVRRFAELGATNVIAIALEYPSSWVQIEAAKQLKGAKGREVILRAVEALELANNYIMIGGTETKIANKKVKSLLIEVICDATGCDPQGVSVTDRASVQSLIDTARRSLQ